MRIFTSILFILVFNTKTMANCSDHYMLVSSNTYFQPQSKYFQDSIFRSLKISDQQFFYEINGSYELKSQEVLFSIKISDHNRSSSIMTKLFYDKNTLHIKSINNKDNLIKLNSRLLQRLENLSGKYLRESFTKPLTINHISVASFADLNYEDTSYHKNQFFGILANKLGIQIPPEASNFRNDDRIKLVKKSSSWSGLTTLDKEKILIKSIRETDFFKSLGKIGYKKINIPFETFKDFYFGNGEVFYSLPVVASKPRVVKSSQETFKEIHQFAEKLKSNFPELDLDIQLFNEYLERESYDLAISEFYHNKANEDYYIGFSDSQSVNSIYRSILRKRDNPELKLFFNKINDLARHGDIQDIYFYYGGEIYSKDDPSLLLSRNTTVAILLNNQVLSLRFKRNY